MEKLKKKDFFLFSIPKDLNIWYLDDGTLTGNTQTVLVDYQ